MVPNKSNWDQKRFKDLVKLDRGSSPRPIVDYITDSEDGVNWIKIGDTKDSTLFINSTKQKITREGAKKSRKVSKGEIILSNSMSYGKPYILNIDGFIHDGWFVIRNYEDSFDKDYLLQYLGSEVIQNQYKRLAAGGVVSNISSDLVYSVRAVVPPLPEQQKIAKILSTWDKAISTTERLIDNSTQQKKALMQQLLTGKKRLLDESGKRFEGKWEQVIFGDVSKLSSKKYNPLKANQCLPCIELEHLDQGSGRIIGSANASELASIKNHFEAGSVLFGKLRPYLRKYARPDFEGVCSTEIWVFKTTSKLLDEYLFHFVQTDKFISEANKSSGSKMPRADWRVISELVIKIPNLKEQQKIATVLTNADKEIELLEQQLADLQQEKKALMQVLLTGKKRVVVGYDTDDNEG